MLEWMKPAGWLISVVYVVIGSPLARTLLASMSRGRRAALSNFLRRVHLLMADRRFYIPYLLGWVGLLGWTVWLTYAHQQGHPLSLALVYVMPPYILTLIFLSWCRILHNQLKRVERERSVARRRSESLRLSASDTANAPIPDPITSTSTTPESQSAPVRLSR